MKFKTFSNDHENKEPAKTNKLSAVKSIFDDPNKKKRSTTNKD